MFSQFSYRNFSEGSCIMASGFICSPAIFNEFVFYCFGQLSKRELHRARVILMATAPGSGCFRKLSKREPHRPIGRSGAELDEQTLTLGGGLVRHKLLGMFLPSFLSLSYFFGLLICCPSFLFIKEK